jgi:hypothetical protein
MKYWNLAIRAITVLILISVSVVTCKIAFLSLSLDVSPINKSIADINSITSGIRYSLNGYHANGDDGILFAVKLAVRESDKAAQAIRQTSQRERDSTAKITSATLATVLTTNQTIGKLGNTIDNVSSSVSIINSSTLPSLNRAIDSLNDSTVNLTGPVVDLIKSSTEVVVSIGKPIASLDALLSDPSWHQTLYNVANTTKHVDGTTADVQKAVHDVLNPKKTTFWKSLVNTAAKSLIPRPTIVFRPKVVR